MTLPMVTLCGSSRFEPMFKEAKRELSLLGLSVFDMSQYPSDRNGALEIDPVEKELLDLVYLGKIAQSHVVLVLDVPVLQTEDGQGEEPPYIGFSAARELTWAALNQIPVVLASGFGAWAEVADTLFGLVNGQCVVNGALDLGRHALAQALGRQQVDQMLEDTRMRVLHAALSHIADRDDPSCDTNAAAFVDGVLEDLGMERLDTNDYVGILDRGVPFDLKVALDRGDGVYPPRSAQDVGIEPGLSGTEARVKEVGDHGIVDAEFEEVDEDRSTVVAPPAGVETYHGQETGRVGSTA